MGRETSTIDSLQDFQAKLEEIHNQNKDNDSNYILVYRGHYKEKIEPNIVGKTEQEHKTINEMMSRCPEELSKRHTTFEKLTYLAHYGLPTRLLDLTENPLVALFFACGGKRLNNEIGNNKGQGRRRVLVFKVLKKDLKFTDSDQVAVLSNFAYFNPEEIKSIKDHLEITNWCYDKYEQYNKYKMHELFDALKRKEVPFNYLRLLARIQKEKPYFRDLITFKDLMNSLVFVRPMYDNPRLKAQQGLFLLFGIKDCDKTEFPDVYDLRTCRSKEEHSGLLAEIEINDNCLKKIQDDLKRLANIDDSTLFPEPDKIATQICYKLGLNRNI